MTFSIRGSATLWRFDGFSQFFLSVCGRSRTYDNLCLSSREVHIGKSCSPLSWTSEITLDSYLSPLGRVAERL